MIKCINLCVKNNKQIIQNIMWSSQSQSQSQKKKKAKYAFLLLLNHHLPLLILCD